MAPSSSIPSSISILAFLDFKKNFISFCNVEVCPLWFSLSPSRQLQYKILLQIVKVMVWWYGPKVWNHIGECPRECLNHWEGSFFEFSNSPMQWQPHVKNFVRFINNEPVEANKIVKSLCFVVDNLMYSICSLLMDFLNLNVWHETTSSIVKRLRDMPCVSLNGQQDYFESFPMPNFLGIH